VGSRCSVAGIEDLNDLSGQWQSAAAIAFGPDDIDVPGIEVDLPGLQGRVSPVLSPHECISVKNATACHRHGDRVWIWVAAVKNNSISRRVNR
jgi:hypothetical protein